MKLYIVDVRGLSPEEKSAVEEKLRLLAYMVTEEPNKSEGVVALRVYWDRKEDFFSSSIFPSNCRCFEVQ